MSSYTHSIHDVSKMVGVVVKDTQPTCELNKNICNVCNKKVKRLAKQMVACDNCSQWYHYVCVGVTEEEAEAMDLMAIGINHPYFIIIFIIYMPVQ